MYNTKNKTQKVYAKNKPVLNLIPKNCVCVFPIEIVGGKTQVSNLGIMPNRKTYDKGSFLYWQEVFDGRSALKLQWVDSITLEKPEGQNYYLAKKSIGSYYYGKPISNGTESLEISEDASFEDFMSMKASQSVTLRFEYNPTDRTGSREEIQSYFRFILTDNDIYNLYLIPELCENKLMYISEHQEYYDDKTGESKGCEITFATLGDKIQKSGKAIEQYCSWNAPGEFSVIPIVKRVYMPGSTDYTKEVDFNHNAYYEPAGIKYLQVELQGPALTSTIYALGRRQEWDSTENCWKIGPSQFLFPLNFITTQPNPLNRTATPSKNYCCFTDEEVSMTTSKKWLEWTLNTVGQPLEQVKNNGMVSIGTNWDTSTWYHESNKPDNSHTTYYDYYDNTWHPIKTDKQYDIDGCVYSENTMILKTTDTMINIFCKNAFIYNQMPIIPLSMVSTKPLYLRDIPLIGTIANFFKLGDIHLKNNTINRQSSHLCFFGDADLMSMCANMNGQIQETPFTSGHYCFPINFFGTNETQYQKLGVNAVNTTFCMSLTDKVNIDGTPRDTVLLGQSKNSDGTNIFTDGHSLLANSSIYPIDPGAGVTYIIDAIVVQSIFDGKIRLSCYGQSERDFIYPQWTATILSNANWENGNVRDWTNFFYLSNWEDRYCVQQDTFTWPEAPHKEDLNTYKWLVNISSSFEKEREALTTWQSQDSRWGNTTEESISGYTSIKCQMTNSGTTTKPRIFYNQTIPYADFGIASITDKDSFINYFKNFTVDCSGSFITLAGHNMSSYDRTFPIKEKVVSTFDLVAGTYNYTRDIKVISLRDNGINNYSDLLKHIFWGAAHTGTTLFSKTQLHYAQTLNLSLSIGDSGVNLTLTDNSYVYGYRTETVSAGKQIVNFENSNGSVSPESVNSTLHIDHLLFNKR